MPLHKDLKRVVRTRMEKTGESYTTARMHIVRTPPAEKIDYAALAGMSEASIAKGTGRSWREWAELLDAFPDRKHGAMAKYVSSLGVNSWWSQNVVVGFERIRGLRARGQKRSGTWAVNKTKTLRAAAADVFAAWNDAKLRKRWLPERVSIRTARAPKSMRITWIDGTNVVVMFADKGSKCAVSIEHEGLPSKDHADQLKKLWGERLEALAAMLQ